VTGVDLSPRSLAIARDLAARLGLPARFVEADVGDLPGVLDERLDVVYASYGVICWVPDMTRWAAVAASFARPVGVVYLADGHPIDVALEPERFSRRGYFDRGARRYADERSYTDGEATIGPPVNYRWTHTLGDVVSALAAAGLRIEFLHEHPRIGDESAAVPSLFSVMASRPIA
jgi:SAM-dependent methyltransferase